MVVLITGLPSSGKTSLAYELCEFSKAIGFFRAKVLDGNAVRMNYLPSLGFKKGARLLNLALISKLAIKESFSNDIVVCSTIAPYEYGRMLFKQNIIDNHLSFRLVYLNTPLSVCISRDDKGLYKKALRGEIRDFTGISDPYEVPSCYDIKLDTTNTLPDECARTVFRSLNFHDQTSLVKA